VTKVDRRTRCLVGWAVTSERSPEIMQQVADGGPEAATTYSDAYEGYQGLVYAGDYVVSDGKDDTYTVEGVNADLRHYLARLARRTRCFSRSLQALRTAIKLFAYYFNRRCLERVAHPEYAPTMALFPSTP
jgi:insertion element IS1 protein InsB